MLCSSTQKFIIKVIYKSTSENPDHPAKTLADAKTNLFEIFSSRFDDAVAQRNQADITRYFKLFPLINCQTEGLDKYSRFVCNIIKARCADEMSSGLGKQSSAC